MSGAVFNKRFHSFPFNVADLSPYIGDDLASRTMPFQGGEDDEDIPSLSTTSPIQDATEIRLGPMTRSRVAQRIGSEPGVPQSTGRETTVSDIAPSCFCL